MIGPEIAALLAPFAKWGALVAGALLTLWLIRRWIRAGAVTGHQAEISEANEEAQRHAQDVAAEHRSHLRRVVDRVRSRSSRSD